jgi:hypothetical protein
MLREPFIVTDAAQLMSEVWRWSPEYLRAAVGAVRLGATAPGDDGKFRYQPGRQLGAETISIAQFFDDVADPGGRRWCMQQISVESELPVLKARLDYPSCIPGNLMKVVNLWLAASSTITPLHYDDSHNLFAQVSGSKTFYLFPPEDLEALYPGPLNTGAQHVSGVDLFDPDFSQHPLAASLTCMDATVNAGEALVLPAFWWHQVASHDLSVSVNFWWRAHVHDCLCPGFMRQLRSAAVQDDLNVLTRAFQFGPGDAPAGAGEAVELARFLADIAEYRAAAALILSVLRAMQEDHASAERAGKILAECPDLAECVSRNSAPDAMSVTRVLNSLILVTS